MKYILIIGDGMADNPLPELGGKTPLEFAKTPAMDRLCSAGRAGTARTVPEGMPAGSDTATLSIFGCDPKLYYGGRAPLEAAAAGITLKPGEIAYRCNMVSLEGGDVPFESKKILSHSAGAIEGDMSDELVRQLWGTAGFKEKAEAAGTRIFPGGSFRHLAVNRAPLRGTDAGLTDDQSRPAYANAAPASVKLQFPVPLTPPHDHIGEPIGPLLPHGSGAADVLADLMRSAHDILDAHPINGQRRGKGKLPANGIWFWAEGMAIKLPGFAEKYGKTGSVISAVPLCRGIGTLIGLSLIDVQGATGELNTNYEGKADAAFEALETNDFVTVHVEAPDECTHDGDLEGKLQAIEWIDSRVIAPLVQKLRESGTEYRMLVLSDHKTLMATRAHSGDPVPFLLCDSRRDENTGTGFCEKTAEQGGRDVDGTGLMGLLFDERHSFGIW